MNNRSTGPYRAVPIAGGKGFSIKAAGGHEIAKINASTAQSIEQKQANANCLAASDELLIALEDIVEQLAHYPELPTDLADSVRVFAKPAIAKAKGGA